MVKKAGLQPFSSNFYDATSAPGTGNPFDPIGGVSQLGANAADPLIQLQQEAESLESALLSTNQPPKTGPLVLFSPSQNKMFVNGALYDAVFDCIGDNKNKDVETIKNSLLRLGKDWLNGAPLQDDITIVVIKKAS